MSSARGGGTGLAKRPKDGTAESGEGQDEAVEGDACIEEEFGDEKNGKKSEGGGEGMNTDFSAEEERNGSENQGGVEWSEGEESQGGGEQGEECDGEAAEKGGAEARTEEVRGEERRGGTSETEKEPLGAAERGIDSKDVLVKGQVGQSGV